MFAGLLIAAAACGADAPPRPVKPASLMVENRSQYELYELRMSGTPAYLQARNMLPQALPIGSAFVLHQSGRWYVTVMREKNRGGKMLAFTTAEPLELFDESGYRLEVFDESFRLALHDYIEPVPSSTTSTITSRRR